MLWVASETATFPSKTAGPPPGAEPAHAATQRNGMAIAPNGLHKTFMQLQHNHHTTGLVSGKGRNAALGLRHAPEVCAWTGLPQTSTPQTLQHHAAPFPAWHHQP